MNSFFAEKVVIYQYVRVTNANIVLSITVSDSSIGFSLFLFCVVINLNELETDDIIKHITAEHIYELCTLCLFGTTVISPRIKILLDRILDTLTQAERENILKSLKWSIDDYEKSYIEHVRMIFQKEISSFCCPKPDTLYQNEHQRLYFFPPYIDRKKSIFFSQSLFLTLSCA